MNKEKYFLIKLEEFSSLIKDEIYPVKDNRLGNYIASIDIIRCNNIKGINYNLRYNEKKLRILSKITIIHMILHEIGHIKGKHEFRKINQIQAEYEAEKFAIETFRRYYPKQYNKVLQSIKGYKTKVYKEAFDRLYYEKIREKE